MSGRSRRHEADEVESGQGHRGRAAVLGIGGLGSHLVRRLAADGWEVLAVDLRTGFTADVPVEARTALADIRDADEMTALLQSFRPDVVVNTAAVSADTARRLPNLAVDVNVLGAASVARSAARSGAGLFVLVSCATVYGGGLAAGPDERVPPAPADLHSGSKAAAESISMAVARQAGMAHLVVRPPALYGHRERSPDTLGWALWRAARDATTSRVAAMPAPVSAGLEVLHVADAARAVGQLVQVEAQLPEVVNVGAGRIWPASELIEAAQLAFPDTQWVAQPWESLAVRIPLDVRLMRGLVGFEPAVDLVEGLRGLGLDRPARRDESGPEA
jgi:nucleoside-diphosphate-sugar epimerase